MKNRILTLILAAVVFTTGYGVGQENEAQKSQEALTVACDESWQAGYDAGKKDGYSEGKKTGYSEGFQEAQKSYVGNDPPLLTFDGSSTRAIETAPSRSEPISETVYITATGKKYHRYGCQYLRQSCIEIEKDDAISRGYTACSKCW